MPCVCHFQFFNRWKQRALLRAFLILCKKPASTVPYFETVVSSTVLLVVDSGSLVAS